MPLTTGCVEVGQPRDPAVMSPLDGESVQESLRNEVGFNSGSAVGVVFTNRAAGSAGATMQHEEGIALHRESDGLAQPRNELRVNDLSRLSVIFANRAGAKVRHEEGIARQRKSLGGT